MKIIKLSISFLFPFLILLCCYAHEDEATFEPTFQSVTLTKGATVALGIKTTKIEEKIYSEIIKSTGQIEEIPDNRFDVNSPVQGKVISISANLGDYVAGGRVLATLQSTEVAKLESEVKQFEAELESYKNAFEREKVLFEKGITAKKDFDIAKANFAGAEAKVSAAKSNLKILSGSLSNPERGTFTVKAPKSGTITERNLTLGQVVNLNQLLFQGIDLTNVLASADIFEKDASKIMLGQKILIRLDSQPDKIFEGHLTYIGSVINKETRTFPVKATLHNPENITGELPLKPGAFFQMEIQTGLEKKSIIIPRTSLVDANKEDNALKHEHTVYIQGDTNPNSKVVFIPKKVEVRSHDSDNVEVILGLKSGDVIVADGGYQLQYAGLEEEHKKQNKLFGRNIVSVVFGFLFLFIIFFLGKKIFKK